MNELGDACDSTAAADELLCKATNFIRVRGRKKNDKVSSVLTLLSQGQDRVSALAQDRPTSQSEVTRRTTTIVIDDGVEAIKKLQDELRAMASEAVLYTRQRIERLQTLQQQVKKLNSALWEVACRAKMTPSVFDFTIRQGKRSQKFLQVVDREIADVVAKLLQEYTLTASQQKIVTDATEPAFRLDFPDDNEVSGKKTTNRRPASKGTSRKRRNHFSVMPSDEESETGEQKRGRLTRSPGGTPYVPNTPEQSPTR